MDGLIGRVGGLQEVLPGTFHAQCFHGELTVHNRYNDVAWAGWAVVLDNHQVTVEDAGVLHAVAADLVDRGPGRVVDEVVVQGNEVGLFLGGGLGLAGTHRAQHGPGEEKLVWDDAALVALDVTSVRQAADEGEDAGRGAQAQDLAQLGHWREGLVALPVGLQCPEVGGIFHLHSVEYLFDGDTVCITSIARKTNMDKPSASVCYFEMNFQN